jgi:hypothetical protein
VYTGDNAFMARSRIRQEIKAELEQPVGVHVLPGLDLSNVPLPREDRRLTRATAEAAGRVGSSAGEQLCWILNFAHLDYERLNEREKASARRELLILLLFGALEGVPIRVFRTYVMEAIDHEAQGLPGAKDRMVSNSEAQNAQEWLAEGIKAIEAGGTFSLDFRKKVEVRLMPSDSPAKRPALAFLDQNPVTDVSARLAARLDEKLWAGRVTGFKIIARSVVRSACALANGAKLIPNRRATSGTINIRGK